MLFLYKKKKCTPFQILKMGPPDDGTKLKKKKLSQSAP